jgi:acyl carrier protein
MRVRAELELLTSRFMAGAGGQEDIDPDENLIDLGFDSVTLLDLLGQINQHFAIDLEIVAILDFPSIAELADHMLDVYGDLLQAALPPANEGL